MPTWLGYLGFLGFLEFVYPPMRYFYLFSLFFLISVIWGWLSGFRPSRRERDADSTGISDSEADNAAKATFEFLVLLGTSPLNPWGFVQSLAHLGGQAIAYLRVRGRLPTAASYLQRTQLTLPVAGSWTIVNGGVTQQTSHSWEILNQRYAYDLVITNSEGHTHRGEGKRLEDYYAFGQPILAPAAGEVVQVRDGVRDYPNPGSGRIDWRTRDFRGNYVIIRHTAREYSFLAHLQCGSVAVRAGDRVGRGQIIGLCGNSGHSTEPHLHFHLQDYPNFYLAVGLPVRFANVTVDAEGAPRSFQERYLSAGERVHDAGVIDDG
jgi:murein DD-endopeptidase MepM/ murein hydrolase activator NlpD